MSRFMSEWLRTAFVINRRSLNGLLMETLSATLVKDEQLFNAISGDETECAILYRVEMPFSMVKNYDEDDEDVRIRGPVYVGDDDMLDRHGELVENDAILNAWAAYAANPVILYNHSKTYGVIGVMESVEMGEFTKPDGEKISVPIGLARIDSGEEDITRKIRKGFLRAFSIGFIAKAAIKECDDADGEQCYMKFTDIEWVETSVVDVPASPGALFSVEKSLLTTDELGAFDIDISDVLQEQLPVHAIPRPAHDCGGDCGCDNCNEKHIVSVVEDESSVSITFEKEYEEVEDEETAESILLSRVRLLEQTIAAYESSLNETESVKNPIEALEGLSNMSDDPVEVPSTEAELPLDEKIAVVAEPEITETEVVEETTDNADGLGVVEAETEEVVVAETEEVVEEVEEESIDEPVTEAESETEDDSIPSSTDVLMGVVKALGDVESAVYSMKAAIDETEELKSALNERDAIIATLQEAKETAETEAHIEAEVSKRIAERTGITPAPKSLAPTPVDQEKHSSTRTGVTRFDPQPEVTDGMKGLAAWLEGRLVEREGPTN